VKNFTPGKIVKYLLDALIIAITTDFVKMQNANVIQVGLGKTVLHKFALTIATIEENVKIGSASALLVGRDSIVA